MKKQILLTLITLFVLFGCMNEAETPSGSSASDHTVSSSVPEPSHVPSDDPLPDPVIIPTPEPEPTEEPDPPAEPEPDAESAVSAVRIDLPQSIQENGHYCGPACLQMVLAYHGIQRSQSVLAQELNTSAVTGTEYADTARVLNTYLFDCEQPGAGAPGYRAEYLVPGQVDEAVMDLFSRRVKQDISTGDPVLAAVDMQTLYPQMPKANHFVVITGYKTLNNEITYYYAVDPYGPVQDSHYKGLKIFTPEEIRQAFNANTEPAYVW